MIEQTSLLFLAQQVLLIMSILSSTSGRTFPPSLATPKCHLCIKEAVGIQDANVPFLLHFDCENCPNQPKWWVCSLCHSSSSSSSMFTKKFSYERHFKDNQKHHQLLMQFKQRMAKVVADASKTHEQRRMEARHLFMRQLALHHFPQESPIGEYFRYQIFTGRSGIYSLAIRSNFKDFDYSNDVLCHDEALLDFQMSAFHHKLPKSLSVMAANIISSAYKLGIRHHGEDISTDGIVHRRIVPPADHNGVNRRYLVGKRSYYQNLPIPEVNSLQDGHAYSSILDCGKVALANGITLAHVTTDLTEDQLGDCYGKLWQTPRAAELAAAARDAGLSADTKIIFYILWRDDVEPNWTKSNRGSVWLLTLSFVGIGAFEKSKSCTFPLSIGRSKSSHDEMEHLVHDLMRHEAAEPRNLYHGATKTDEKVAFLPFIISTDSPEKRKATGTAMGNGTSHARFRCSADHNRLLAIIRPCDSCRSMMTSGQLPNGCNECANWDVLKAGGYLGDKLKLPPKDKYPMSFLEDNGNGFSYLTDDGMLVPFQLTFSRLRASYQLAFDNFAGFHWTETEVREFLSVECINTKLVDELLEHGANARTIADIKKKAFNLIEELEHMLLWNAEIHPEDYSCPPGMAVWIGADGIAIFVDAPMHLIFLGIIKTTLFMIKKWLGKGGYLEDFLKRCKELNALLNDLHIDWLRIEDFRDGKFGGWVSENFVAFSRVMLWFFQDLGTLMRESVLQEDSEPPSQVPNTTWKQKHYWRWFYDRGLEDCILQKPTKAEMKCKILLLMAKDEVPPVMDRSAEHEPKQIEIVLLALDAMITVLMTDEVIPEVTCPLAELRIKHFLTEFDILDQSCLKAGKKPKVISASNYLTLLNLPETMRRFGPLRGIWEGHWCGEGFVRKVKPHLRYGQRVNFGSNAMKHCLKESVLEMAAEKFSGTTCEAKPTNHWAAVIQGSRDSFCTHDNRKDILDRLQGRDVLSAVAFLDPTSSSEDGSRETHIYAVAKHDSSKTDDVTTTDENLINLQLYRLQKGTDKISTKLTMRYYSWQLSFSPTNWGDLLAAHPPQVCEFTFGCLLPLLGDTDDSLHMLICKDRSVYS